MRIFDDPQGAARRNANGGDSDAFAYLLDPIEAAPAPAETRAARAASASATPQYVTGPASGSPLGSRPARSADPRSDVERLIEIGLDAEEGGEPRLGGSQLRCWVNDGA